MLVLSIVPKCCPVKCKKNAQFEDLCLKSKFLCGQRKMKKRDKIEGWNIVRGSEASQCWLKNRHNLRCDSNLTSSKILQSGNCQILFFTEEKMRYALYLSTMYYGEYGLMGAQLPILLSLFFPYVFFFFLSLTDNF